MRGRLTSTRFVGRHQQLVELELACREARDGQPGLILLGGDSGVGKTRLLNEAEQTLAGTLTLRGECLEQGEMELPYAPLLSALRPLVRGGDAVFHDLSAGSRGSLAALLPSVATEAPPALAADGQIRLFEGLLELLHLLTSRQPVFLILEDMHWADPSTRTFVAFLARSLTDERLLTVLSYREDELHRRHPLRPLLAELSRLDRARLLHIDPFDRQELAEALSDILGQAPQEDLIDRLLSRTDGNPLYVEELLAAALDGRGSTPQSLRDAFMLRIERLSADADAAVRAVAVGRALAEPLITELTGFDSSGLHEALREAVAERILIAGDDGQFRFRHALLREVVYDDLLPGEREAMHLALARALEQAVPEDCADDEAARVAAVATHYAAAGDQAAALRATVTAAREARRVHAHGEAAELYERALALWPRVQDPESMAGVDEVDLLQAASSAHASEGDMRRSELLADRGLTLLDPERDPVRVARLTFRRGRSRWRLNQAAEALRDAERALALLPDDADADRARVLSWAARTQSLRGHYREAIAEGERALTLAREAQLPMIVGEALNTVGMARIVRGEVEAGEALLRDAINLACEQDDMDDLGTAYSNLAEHLNLAGRTGDALAVMEQGLALMERKLGRFYSWMQMTFATLAFEAGDWDAARATELPPPSAFQGVSLIFRLLCEAEIALGEGDDARTRARLDAAGPLVKVTREPQWHGLYGSLLGELQRRAGDLAAAQRAVQAALDELEVCTDDVMRIARVSAVGLAVEADRARRARDLREPAEESDALARAQIHISRLDAAAEEGGPVEQAWQAVGLAELARAEGYNDPGRWHAAAASWDSLQRPYCAATARWRKTEALVEADDRAAAAATAAAAMQTAERLGAGWLLGELRGLVSRARLESPATEADGSAPAGANSDEAEAEDPFGLTPREMQVLKLISEGATNRQIGESLYMAEKTASVHVSRILAKLDVRSRTQAAALAHRLHLV